MRIRLFLGIGLVVSLVLLSMRAQATAYSPSESNALAWLHTEGTNIIDDRGMVFVPKGAAVMELAYRRTLYRPAQQVLSEMKDLGANSLRLAVNSAFWKEYPSYREVIDEIAAVAEEIGIYVIVDLHDTLLKPQDYNEAQVYADMQNPDGMIAFLVDVAARYQENSAVLYSVLGQPLHTMRHFTQQNEMLWWNLALKIARAMHQVNPKALLFVPSLDAGSIRQNFLDNPLPEPNVVYTVHRYYHFDLGWSDYAKAYASGDVGRGAKLMETFYTRIMFQMLEKGYPVGLIEFGSTTQDPNWDTQISDLYLLLNKYRVGYLQWVWYEPRFPYLGLHLPDYSLSPQGRLWVTNL